MLKPLQFSFLIFLSLLQSCLGFAGYDKPAKTSNKYYRRNFKLTNSKLKIGRHYVDLENQGLHANNSNEYSFFTFFENGFVLHNSGFGVDKNNLPITVLNYSQIHSEDIGSYILKGDTIFWGTRPGYLKKKATFYYQCIITDTGLNVLSSSKSDLPKFFKLQ